MRYLVGYEHLRTYLERHPVAHDIVKVRRRQEVVGLAHAATELGGMSACGNVTIGYLTEQPWPVLANTCLDCLELVPPDLDEGDIHAYLDFANHEFPEGVVGVMRQRVRVGSCVIPSAMLSARLTRSMVAGVTPPRRFAGVSSDA